MTEIKKYYRSIDQLEQSEGFKELLKREFPDVDPVKLDPVSRRRFLQLMGASATLASAAGCRWEEQKVITFNERPEDRTPGEPQHFATAMEVAGVAEPLLMTCYDGRPIKAEGNPSHPESRGAAGAFAQASILGLYDPERSRCVRKTGTDQELDYDQFLAQIDGLLEELRSTRGAGFAVLSESSSSPTLHDLKTRLLDEWSGASWHEYEPVSDDERREGSRAAFGSIWRPILELEQADVILCLDCDLLGSHPAATRLSREFAARRDPDQGPMNRLYAVESRFTLTGASADHRLPLRSGLIGTFLVELMGELGVEGFQKSRKLIGRERVSAFAKALAEDLRHARGKSLVVAGDGQPAAVSALVHRLNDWLGNAGKTVSYVLEADQDREPHVASLRSLVEQIEAGTVRTLLILGGNPVYDAPADVDFAAALGRVATSFHLSLYPDETGSRCTWHLHRAHFLESWSDARSYDGTLSIVQPTISPLHGGKTAAEVLALFLADELVDGYDLVRRTFDGQVSADELVWRRALHDGLVAGSGFERQTPSLNDSTSAFSLPVVDAALSDELENGRLELTFAADCKTFDGRFANNGWLQEMPEPMTRMCWDNAALLSPATADRFGVKTGDMLLLEKGDRRLSIAAYVMPGQAPGSVSVTLGYGRSRAGAIGGSEALAVPAVGFNAYRLRSGGAADIENGLKLTRTGERHSFALVQDHHMIDSTGLDEREERLDFLVREADVGHYLENPEFAKQPDQHGPELKSLWAEHPYEGKRWGMAIDLTRCTGCNACVLACQAENNIPIVGKEQVQNGREMHWLRIDRYFSGDVNDPESVTQPVTCQHCENAPCEEVCPVGATTHSKEGLNDMAYNRCIGTRYCSNNCPYKVRRFNYFNYHLELELPRNEVRKLAYNPEVTIRARGVMEKCSFCVQKIVKARIRSKVDDRPTRDGEILPACAQTCASQAISFGDLSDPSSRVSKDHANRRSYPLLAMLNVKPRNAYLARIRNPNPALARPVAESDHH